MILRSILAIVAIGAVGLGRNDLALAQTTDGPRTHPSRDLALCVSDREEQLDVEMLIRGRTPLAGLE